MHDQQPHHLLQQILHRFRQMLAPETCDGIMIRNFLPFQQIHKILILTAGSLNLTGTVDPTAAGVQHYLEQQTG